MSAAPENVSLPGRRLQNDMSFARVIAIGAAFLLQACTNAAPRSIVFNQDSTQGLVVFGLASDGAAPISLTIAQFDRDAGRVSANSFAGQYFVEHSGQQLSHHVMRVPSGTYAIKYVGVERGYSTTMVCLSGGTLAFEVKPGQQLYLGDFMFDGQGFSQLRPDMDSAQAAMKSYPNVQGILAVAEVSRTTFKNSSRLGKEICGG